MADPKRRRNRLLGLATVAGMCVIGPAVTILLGLGSVTSFAAYMDVHGATVTMRLAAFGAIAMVVVTAGAGVISARCERIERQLHRARLAALSRPPAASAHKPSSPASHRKVA